MSFTVSGLTCGVMGLGIIYSEIYNCYRREELDVCQKSKMQCVLFNTALFTLHGKWTHKARKTMLCNLGIFYIPILEAHSECY